MLDTLGEPLHDNVTGDSAYVVVPATMTFKVHANRLPNRRGLHGGACKFIDGWRIAAWVWAKGIAQPHACSELFTTKTTYSVRSRRKPTRLLAEYRYSEI